MFGEAVGYSPELAELARGAYCYGDWARCARYIAWTDLGVRDEEALADLFPSDMARIDQLRRELGM